MRYIAPNDFISSDPNIGAVTKGRIFDDSAKARDLKATGYLEEYKTKVVRQRPEKPKKKTVKK